MMAVVVVAGRERRGKRCKQGSWAGEGGGGGGGARKACGRVAGAGLQMKAAPTGPSTPNPTGKGQVPGARTGRGGARGRLQPAWNWVMSTATAISCRCNGSARTCRTTMLVSGATCAARRSNMNEWMNKKTPQYAVWRAGVSRGKALGQGTCCRLGVAEGVASGAAVCGAAGLGGGCNAGLEHRQPNCSTCCCFSCCCFSCCCFCCCCTTCCYCTSCCRCELRGGVTCRTDWSCAACAP